MINRKLYVISLLAFGVMSATASAQDRLKVNGYLGPPTPDTCFWTEREFRNFPERGPADAAGIVLWSHGGSGNEGAEWHHGAPPVIRRFAENNWDVVLIQRNEKCGGGWGRRGAGYIDNMLAEVGKAKARGYRRVLVAGQSFGAGIALGAGASDKVDGVLAFALSHGRASCRDILTFKPEMIPQQERYIREGIEADVSPRVLVSMATGDQCVNHSFSPMIHEALEKKRIAYIHLDENSIPFTGHSVVRRKEYADLFGTCILKFFTQDPPPPVGRTACR